MTWVILIGSPAQSKSSAGLLESGIELMYNRGKTVKEIKKNF